MPPTVSALPCSILAAPFQVDRLQEPPFRRCDMWFCRLISVKTLELSLRLAHVSKALSETFICQKGMTWPRVCLNSINREDTASSKILDNLHQHGVILERCCVELSSAMLTSSRLAELMGQPLGRDQKAFAKRAKVARSQKLLLPQGIAYRCDASFMPVV